VGDRGAQTISIDFHGPSDLVTLLAQAYIHSHKSCHYLLVVLCAVGESPGRGHSRQQEGVLGFYFAPGC
jgi:hypothetical protein